MKAFLVGYTAGLRGDKLEYDKFSDYEQQIFYEIGRLRGVERRIAAIERRSEGGEQTSKTEGKPLTGKENDGN